MNPVYQRILVHGYINIFIRVKQTLLIRITQNTMQGHKFIYQLGMKHLLLYKSTFQQHTNTSAHSHTHTHTNQARRLDT